MPSWFWPLALALVVALAALGFAALALVRPGAGTRWRQRVAKRASNVIASLGLPFVESLLAPDGAAFALDLTTAFALDLTTAFGDLAWLGPVLDFARIASRGARPTPDEHPEHVGCLSKQLLRRQSGLATKNNVAAHTHSVVGPTTANA